jgi:hypothetical protein
MTTMKPVPSMESLRAQRDHFIEKCAALQEQKNALELELSVIRLGQAIETDKRVGRVEDDLNALRNWITGHVVQNDEEYRRMQERVSWLWGNANV